MTRRGRRQRDRSSGPQRERRLNVEQREVESVKPLELFFDLVFVLGFTQCTALMVAQPTWSGVGRGMVVLAILWWSWIGFAWLTSVIDPEEGAVRLVMFAAMAGLLITALCVPEAFGDRAIPFAIAYSVVRVANLGLFFIASRDDDQLRRSVRGNAGFTMLAVALLIVGSTVEGEARVVLWGLAIAVDWLGPIGHGMEGWRLMPAHFAERHNLVIILALGESIVALGIAAEVDLTAEVTVAAVLGIGLASALWWVYFDVVALVTERRLTDAASRLDRNRLARDSYTYLHFPMVAGIVLVALGLEQTVAHVDDALDVVGAFALLGGTAIYLLAHVALRLRNAHTLNRQRFALAVVLFALIPAATEVTALVSLAAINVLIWAMIVFETSLYDERRYRLRHRLPIEDPAAPTDDA